LISVVQLGTIDYATALHLQQHLIALRKDGKIGDVLLLLEHSPVITLGRNAKAGNVIASPELLARRGVDLFECDRGGDVTFHGPGQIVGYPIFDLRGFRRPSSLSSRASQSESDGESRDLGFPVRKHLGVVEFVRCLEDVLMRTCADFSIATKRVAGLTGVWTEPTLSSRADENDSQNRSLKSRDLEVALGYPESKLAAIGVHVSRFVTSHGFALNVNTDLSYFNLIVPCGIASKPVTSMRRELGYNIDLNAVAESISRNFGVVFQAQILWIDSLDALLDACGAGAPARVP